MSGIPAATVRSVARKLAASRAAITLVSRAPSSLAKLSFFVPQTASAVSKVKEIIATRTECVGLRVGVKTRGCNGLTYTLDYAKTKEKFDEEVKQEDVRIFIDRKAQMSLLGTEMDFIETKLSSEFVFNNPNVKGTCGCGESFSI